MTRKTETVTAPAQTVAPITALPPELLVAVDAVNQRVRDCEKLDAAIDACPADRARLDGEHADLTEKLATAEAALALADRGSDAEVQHLTSVEKLTLSLASVEREQKRIDARELALEAQGEPLAAKLAQAVAELRREMNIFVGTLCEAIAQEYRAALPALLTARARLNVLATLDPSVRDSLWDSHLIDPTSRYQHLLLDGPRRQLYADEDMLASQHPDADAAGEALATLLQPVAKALAAGRRPPFRTLRERRMMATPYVIKGYSISTGHAVPAAPPKPPVPSLEAQSRSYEARSDSFGARTRAAVDGNVAGEIVNNMMRGD